MPYENLLLDKANGVASITLNRPPVNALSVGLLTDLAAALEEIAYEDSVRAVVITGSGDRFFSGGAEIKEFNVVDPIKQCGMGHDVFRHIETLGKPVIAAVNGFALGGGCELAMACHIRYAADTARFGQPEINLGIIPGWGGTQRLPRLVGRGRAFEMMLTGDHIPAADAERFGLVNRVCPAAELKDAAQKLAARLAALPPLAVKAILECVNVGVTRGIEEGWETERAQFAWIGKSEDARAAIQAFLTKQKPPVYKGK